MKLHIMLIKLFKIELIVWVPTVAVIVLLSFVLDSNSAGSSIYDGFFGLLIYVASIVVLIEQVKKAFKHLSRVRLARLVALAFMVYLALTAGAAIFAWSR